MGAGVDASGGGGRFPAAYGISTSGPVLVRPDGVVAWRSTGPVEDPAGRLATVLTSLLAGTPAARLT